MHLSGFVTAFLAVLVVAVVGLQDAEARRLGGGKSFGSRPSHSAPYKRSATPARPSPGQQAVQQQNAQRRAQLANRGGLWGMLGGLALGGLLGALFFGGAFENLNFLDIAIFALIGFLLYRLFAARARRAASHAGGGGQPAGTSATPGAGVHREADPGTEARRDWGLDSEAMDRKFGKGESDDGSPPEESADVREEGDAQVPSDFDEQAFLKGAERAYRMLQEAWDRGDLDEIERFTTEAVFAEISSQFQDRHGENRTEILSLDARLMEVRRVGDAMEAGVLFDAYLREVDASSGSDERGRQAREVWHFVRPSDASEPTWYLDGIQQLED